MGEQVEQSSMMLEDREQLLEMYNSIFDIIYNWIVVVDRQGIIRMINSRYCHFLGVEQQEAVGKHVTEIIENTRMHIVAQNGRREIGDIQQIKGNKMIADRIPIYQKGQLIGAVGTVIFKDVVELDAYVKRVGHMEKELDFYKKELKKALGTDNTFDNIIGTSQALQRAMNLAKRVASTKSNVLLLGESGTGKGLFASAIHNASPRSEYPLIKVNCAAIPSELLESELFGYEGGAFTGAKKGGKPGKFELAHKSSIFLDEIGDLPLNMQAKLLKVLQEKEIERVGGVKSQKVDIRIIAATNRNLEEMVKEKTFREDLYYRLNVINIRIPSLRERKEDIPMLADYLIRKTAKEMDRFVTEISPAAMRCLVEYQWPGNIRELENVIERAFNLVDKEAGITLKQLPTYLVAEQETEAVYAETSLKEAVEAVERKTISRCLNETMGNKYQTARLLGISRTSLYEKMEKYGIEVSK
ncbi:sigma-54 interaction domain-containing protein [Anoxynatronum buryatiense]|uniref:PAS domain S-box-containing protein n=1 Tax=Anoxynatronum buryatiense TaxID=489973 RepID=A0AA45WYS1_9CLOT|nr:sigma 54-interacting transcriptional regulator [Anoxynatronum buryatiense]SMP70242.1 PAS domain S-box-containing protein [Anoxynatronum buryatiense]